MLFQNKYLLYLPALSFNIQVQGGDVHPHRISKEATSWPVCENIYHLIQWWPTFRNKSPPAGAVPSRSTAAHVVRPWVPRQGCVLSRRNSPPAAGSQCLSWRERRDNAAPIPSNVSRARSWRRSRSEGLARGVLTRACATSVVGRGVYVKFTQQDVLETKDAELRG